MIDNRHLPQWQVASVSSSNEWRGARTCHFVGSSAFRNTCHPCCCRHGRQIDAERGAGADCQDSWWRPQVTHTLAHVYSKFHFMYYLFNCFCVFHSFFLDDEALESIMSAKEIKDKPVCIVSVAGKWRVGDLNNFKNAVLEYLNHQRMTGGLNLVLQSFLLAIEAIQAIQAMDDTWYSVAVK